MKQKLFGIIPVFKAVLILAVSCATGGASSQVVSLDEAIQLAVENIEQNLPNAGLDAAASAEQAMQSGADGLDNLRQAAQGFSQRPRIAVLNFSSPTEQLSEYVIAEISTQLVNGKKAVVVDRRELDLIRQEEQFQLSGEVSDESAQSIGKKLGAQLVVSGSLDAIGSTYRFRIRALSVETAVVEAASSADINLKETKIAYLLSGAQPVPVVAQQARPVPAVKADNAAAVQQPPVFDDFEYEIVNGKSITITGYTGEAATVQIPTRIQNLPVTSIGEYAFAHCDNLTSVTIPSSVTFIDDHAFWACKSLISITIPSSVTSIGEYAFAHCSSLTSVTIPSSVMSIGDGTFWDCSNLISVTIPSSITSIGKGAFEDCKSLTSITIPSSVTSIGDNAFYRCKSLTSTTIPTSVTSIGEKAFYFCSSLTSIIIPTSVTSIGGNFYGCSSLTSITLPSSVTIIGDFIFSECSKLDSINIPSSVTSISRTAFASCKSLTSINIPSSVTSIGDSAFMWCYSLTSVTIPSSVTSIGNNAFYDCRRLTSVTLSRRTQVGKSAFFDSTQITYRD